MFEKLIRTAQDGAEQVRFNANYISRIVRHESVDEFQGSQELADFFEPAVRLGRSIIFACPHWGSYLRSFNLIGNSLSAGSKFIALRGDIWSEDEGVLWADINRQSKNDIAVYRVLDRKGLAGVARAMRNGTHAFILFDLFEKYGKTEPIRFFDREIRVTTRWIDLAHLAQSLVVFIMPMSIRRGMVEVRCVIDPAAESSPERFKRRCMEACSECLEALIVEEPRFWFMWEHSSKYGMRID